MGNSAFSHRPFKQSAWTQPYTYSMFTLVEGAAPAGILVHVPFKIYRLHSIMLSIVSGTLGTSSPSFDLQGYDIDAGSANADMFTFTAQAFDLSKTVVMHKDKAKSGYYDTGAALFTQADANQIVPKEVNLFSTSNDARVPAENRGMVPYLLFAGTPRNLRINTVVAVEPVVE